MATTGVAAYSTTPGSNTSLNSISIAEGMSPGDLNNALRQVVADIAVYRNLVGCAASSGGTADAQTLTTGMTLAAYQAGLVMGFKAGSGLTNTGACTMNVDSLGAKSIKLPSGSDPGAGAITAGGTYQLVYTAADVLMLLGG